MEKQRLVGLHAPLETTIHVHGEAYLYPLGYELPVVLDMLLEGTTVITVASRGVR